MRVSAVVAASDNGVIGRDGGLPWRVPSDLRVFRQVTMGKPVIMGRKTWEALPRQPLPGRHNIVITRQDGYRAEGADVVCSVEAALDMCGEVEEACLIGGGEIYRQGLERTDRIYLTRIHLTCDGDTFLPELDARAWREVSRQAFERSDGDDAAFTLIVLDRERT